MDSAEEISKEEGNNSLIPSSTGAVIVRDEVDSRYAFIIITTYVFWQKLYGYRRHSVAGDINEQHGRLQFETVELEHAGAFCLFAVKFQMLLASA